MKRTGRKLIGMAAAVLLMASAFCTAVYAADGFSSEYERLLDTAYILSDAEADEIFPDCIRDRRNTADWYITVLIRLRF